MGTYWVCPPDSAPADETAAALAANGDGSRGNSIPKGASSLAGHSCKEEHLSGSCSVTVASSAQRSPHSSHVPPYHDRPSLSSDSAHQTATLHSGSDKATENSDKATAGSLPSGPLGPLKGFAALKRHALLLCGKSEARNLPASTLSPGQAPSRPTPPSPLFSRRSPLAAVPVIPTNILEDPPLEATAAAAVLEGTVADVPVLSLPAPMTADSVESVVVAALPRSCNEPVEDWY